MKKLKAFMLGVAEFRSDYTARYHDLAVLEAYEWGREWAHRLTFRRFEK